MTGKKDTETEKADSGLNRRDFFKAGAAVGVGAATLGAPAIALAEQDVPMATSGPWDYEADIVIAGGGCAGITAAIRARDTGASVLVVDQNFDLGGRMLHSGSFLSLGGGDVIQKRDMAGQADREGFITVPPAEEPAELDDSVDLLFTDVTDWSVVDGKAQSPYRYNERELMRAWAENCPPTRQFLMDNYIRFTRISGTHGGGGLSRARAPYCFLMLGDVTDIKAGTITREDAGLVHPERTSPFAPVQMEDAESFVGPGAVRNGVALARPLEFSAREKGVVFMLNRRFTDLVQDPDSGRILGIKGTYSPRINPETGERLESFWQNGNVDERRETVSIRAKKAVILASGGHAGNPQVRSMFYPAMREPAFPTSGMALQGPGGQDASAMIAALKVGANLAGMQQNLSYPTTFHIATRLGTRDAYTDMMPGHPTFVFRGSSGLGVGNAGFEEFIAVNQVGKRFFNEVRLPKRPGGNRYPGDGAAPGQGLEHKPRDWRNCSAEWIKQSYNYDHGLDAAIAINEGSKAPHYYSGPLWAIFDQDAVDRTGWEIRYPFVNESNGYYFKADTIAELTRKIEAGHPFQRVPLSYLDSTIVSWNTYVTNNLDPEFDRHVDAPMYAIAKPPFYALSIMVIWHDSYGGLRVNGRQQVIDMHGQPIPGLYAGGEAVGGFNKHGLGKGHVHGFIAGTHAAAELG
ncbi:MAG: FAD-dependent oxidoreductase [Pseudomonadota bacterium]